MSSKEEAHKKISELVERFDEQYQSYKNASYNETLTRRDFIDPFFEALGWDINNRQGYAEAYREVIHEDKQKVDGRMKSPDYSFKLPGGKRLFFVEAKKPIVDIKNDSDPAYQLRRYAWNAKLDISIVTDFEELAVYDCKKKPKVKDKANTARLKYINYKDYLQEENFNFIWDTFAKERVLKGSFDKFLASDASKRGKETVDDDFLKSIEEWRTRLAVNIGLKNPTINEDELNFAVQMTLDRLIFLRICEDRGIERYGRMQEEIKQGTYYTNLFKYFQQADDKYNSGLFDFKKDKLSQSISIDNKVMKEIIDSLYDGPYIFDVIPVEILGNAYEQFLGKVIKLNDKHNVVIEEKPEVRKAGGVYYTPQYIVDYIVKNTVGKMIEGQKPESIAKIKIVDPACGSGSFLLGAYSYLLDYHKKYYRDNPPTKKKDFPLTPNGELTTNEKKKILINNIYGVDIDTQAVEVTKLSLLLKCMEGETEASIQHQFSLFHDRVLPTLDSNIKGGNSLISSDFYDSQLDFEPGVEKKIKPFDWEKAFANVFKQGGFDVVIGNPPYIQLAMFEWFKDEEKQYMLTKFCSSMGRMNTFGFFIEKGINLLKEKGQLGFIVPNTILTQEYYQELRNLILTKTHIDDIVSYEHLPFADAVVETTTILLRKEKSKAKTKITFCTKELEYQEKFINQESFTISYKNQFNVISNEIESRLKNKIEKTSNKTLNKLTEINQAIALKSDRAAYLYDTQKGSNYKPVLDGREINRYETNWSGKYLKYDINAIHSCKREDIFTSKEKIFFRRVSSTLIATLDIHQFYALNTLVAINLKKDITTDIKYILGVFNSRLMNFYYSKFLKSTKKVFSEIQARQIGQLPFIEINFKNKEQTSIHDNIVKLVDTMLSLNKELQETSVPDRQEQLRTRIDHTDRRIDRLVYELYGLTEDEVAIVEGR